MTFFPDGKTFVQIGSFSIAWYAICIITGAFIAYKLGQYNFKKIGYNKEILSDYFFGLMITGVLGARLDVYKRQNQQRAEIANKNNAGAFIRLHCNSDDSSSIHGTLTMAPSESNPYCSQIATASQRLSKTVVNSICNQTGSKNRGVIITDVMSGINSVSYTHLDVYKRQVYFQEQERPKQEA